MCRVLIVDDSAAVRKIIREALGTRFPFMRIQEAGSGEEALWHVEALAPHLMLIDIGLPGENGLTLTRRVRSAHADVAIIILTNHDDPEYREAGLASGADRFMSKAASGRAEIVAAVEELLLAKRLPVTVNPSLPVSGPEAG